MPKTALPPSPQPQATPIRRRRALRIAVPTLVLIVATVAVAMVEQHGRSGDRTLFGPTSHQVTYEVQGRGIAPEITYWVGAHQPVVLHKVGLPWQATVNVPVGVGGDITTLVSTNPPPPAGKLPAGSPLVCRILVDGKETAQRTSPDGYYDAACSTALAAGRG